MIRALLFWLIVAPASLAFLLGFLASVAQSMANRLSSEEIPGEQNVETLP